ncbi:MAG TPA: nickel-binding protein [Acidimicrobiales bacterium]|nr:nickel-binding protein [Acidimicrobiales bacterium]
MATGDLLTNYLIEFYLPRSGRAEFRTTSRRARAVAREMSREGISVRCLRSVFVPSDETCLYLYAADSEDTVREAARRAGLPVLRVSQALADGGDG